MFRRKNREATSRSGALAIAIALCGLASTVHAQAPAPSAAASASAPAASAPPSSAPPAPHTEKPKTATLGWARLDGAESCIGTQELAQRVERLLGRAVFVSPSSAELAIEGRVGRTPEGGFKAVLGVASASGASLGTRELVATTCAELGETVELAIALMIDPDAKLDGGAPAKPDPIEDGGPKVVEKKVFVPVYVPTPSPPKKEPLPWRGEVSAGFALGFGWLPTISPGVFGGAGLEPPFFIPLESEITFFAPHDEEVAGAAFVRFYSLQGAGFACPLDFKGSLGGLRACAGLEGGFLVADSEGFAYEDKDESGVYGMFGAVLRGRGTLHVAGPFRLGLGAELNVPFFRPELFYRDKRGADVTLFQPAPVLGKVSALALFAFP